MLCLAQLEKMNLLLGVSLAIISIGSLGAVQGELRFSVFGFWMIIASEFIEAFKLVSQQNLMGSLKFEIVEGLFWMSPGRHLPLLPAYARNSWTQHRCLCAQTHIPLISLSPSALVARIVVVNLRS